VAPEVGEIVSDRRRVEQIVLNLLNNAIKFTDRGSVTLTARGGRFPAFARRPGAAAVRIAVADTGIGIKAEHLARSFSRSSRWTRA
jgi:signal transduction histidine kinase